MHLAHLGHPLIGDPTYGRARKPPRPKTQAQDDAYAAVEHFPRQALHAFLLGFKHPTSTETDAFESPWPADFA